MLTLEHDDQQCAALSMHLSITDNVSPKVPDDIPLIERLLQRDEQAFRELISSYQHQTLIAAD